MRYGYMRVSTKDKQEFDRQIFVLKDYNLDRIFEEKISGTKKAASREAFQELLNVLAVGDEVYFESMSRMARSMQDLIDTTNVLVKQYKVKVVFVKENLAIGGGSGLDAMGALIFNIMGAFAQFERDLISDRTKTALSAKREQGIVLGRPTKTSQQTIDRIRELREAGLTISEIAVALEMPKSTVGRICKESEGK